MGLYVLLLFVVGCWSIQWKPINDFEDTFLEFSQAAIDTVSSIERILDSSRSESELFLNNTFSKNPIINRLTEMKLSKDKCIESFINKDNLKFSYHIQIYQLQIPLRSRVVDIKERLKNINSSLEIYQGLVESKFHSCKSENRNCLEITNEWLESAIDSLSCAIYPGCSKHSIRKRSTCLPGQFSCTNGECISGRYFCDSYCHCKDCSDRPPACVKSCYEFRCRDTFRCISLDKKCNGIDDCGDGSDEEGCPPSTTLTYTHANCSIQAGEFLCDNNKCIGLERVCDSYNDCGDWSDEDDHCNNPQCSPECSRKGGVCFTGPKGSECFYECPSGTYETPEGCKRNPEAPLATLLQVLEDTPRLISRYEARLKYLKIKTILALSNALREVVKCKKEEYALLSRTIDLSTVNKEHKELIKDEQVTHQATVVTTANVD